MRVVVTGASGFLGWHLARSLEPHHEVLACWHSRPVSFEKARTAQLDLKNADAAGKILRDFEPTHVVHAAAMTQTGDCERNPALADEINHGATRRLLDLMSDNATAGNQPNGSRAPHVVYLSTDLVFDGTKPGGRYAESDVPNPLMVYGRTKRDAEQAVRSWAESTGGRAAILRSALIYGPPGPPSSCFVEWMVEGIRKGEGVLFTDEYRTPVHVHDLCQVIEAAGREYADGLFHVGGPDRLSRHEFGLLVAEAFGLPTENVRGARAADVTTGSPRPADVSLNISHAADVLGFTPRPCRQGLADLHQNA